MALTVSSVHGISSAGESSEHALQGAAGGHGLAGGALSPFKLISEDILVKIFSRLEEDPRHLARMACVCRRFAHVIRNVCWKRQCTRIVPDLMPSPQTHLDQIPEPLGGWGALLKVLVCCPGLKHAGVTTTCCDFGLEREIGPMELYDIGVRYVPERRIAVELVQQPVCGELESAAAAANPPVVTYTLSVRESSVRRDTTSTRDSRMGTNFRRVDGSHEVVQKPAVAAENGNDCGNGDGHSSEQDSPATGHAFAPGTGFDEESASKGRLPVGPKCLAKGGGQEQGKLAALAEESSSSPLARNSQGKLLTLSCESKASAAAVPEEGIVQFSTQQLSYAPAAGNEDSPTGSRHVGMAAVTVEKNGRSAASIDPSSAAAEVQFGAGRPPRGAKRVRWKEEELLSNGEKVVGPKLGGSGELVAERERGRSRKRKERALRRILAKVPEDPKQRLHIVPAKWTMPREEGSRLLASRLRCDSLYICDWPGCVHPGEKRNYKLFRGFVKNFKASLLCRNLKDMNARKIDVACAFCSATSTWDMMTAFCLRRSFEYHDDGEPVVHACVCENGHVSGAWTDRPGLFAAR